MSSRLKVAVIGGGVSGFAAAKAFAQQGHTVAGYERGSDFGGVWELSRSYPDVQTQSPKDLYRYTDMEMPAEYPEWPKGTQVNSYLHSYARKHGLDDLYTLNANVVSMERRKDKLAGWTLNIDIAGAKSVESFDFVAVCTGQFSNPKQVSHPGDDEFKRLGGQIIHSSEYTDAAIANKRQVLVLGGSKSATDIAVNAAKSGAKSVALVYRENVWRIPYFVGGINFKRLLYMRAQEQQFNAWGRNSLQRAVATIFKPLVWANFRGLETLLKFQLGLKRWDMVPNTAIEKTVSCSAPIVTPGLFEGFKSGQIKPARATIDRYEGKNVVLNDGTSLSCDLVVQATGWHLGVPFLQQHFQDKLIEPDGQYRLYRLAVNPDLPDMGFVGFNSSFCSVLSSEMIANWLVRYADRQLKQQPTSADMHADINMMLNWRRNERPAARVYGGLCSAPFHFKHFDELLSDMGAIKNKRSNPLAEQFSYPNADAFGEYLASVPKYVLESEAEASGLEKSRNRKTETAIN